MTTVTHIPGAHGRPAPSGRLGNALRAVRVFTTAALEVVLLGEYTEEAEAKAAAGVRRR
ncbi:hypothetical protein AB0A69_09255 [Streptomyces sp. NPDC045431]|uniref:hypothetical protein n=1 Tax=Streptomyces sp. NPDC045431 TaxID=3155613 RepID=UPI0033EA5294